LNKPAPDTAARIALCLLGLMLVLPFLQPRHFLPLPLFYSEWLAGVLGLMAFFLFLLPRYARDVEVPWVVLTPLALCGVLLLHLVLLKAAYPQQILLALLYLLWAGALILLGAALRREFGLAALSAVLAWFILAGGLLNALAGILQHYELRGILEPVIASKTSPAIYGNLAQPNHFANHIALALASLLFLHARGRLHLAVAALLGGLLLFVLSLSGSRSAWLYLGALAVLATLLHFRHPGAEHKRLLVFSLLLLPGFVFAQWLVQQPWLSAPTSMVTPTERLFEYVRGASARFQLWREAWLMFLQSPLMGVGYGQFAWQHFQLAGSIGNPASVGHANNAHNVLVQVLAETGALGAAALLSGIAVWLWGLRRATFNLDRWWLLALLGVLGIHSMLEYPLWHAYFLGLAAVLFGAAESPHVRLQMPRAISAGFAILMFAGTLSAVSLLHNYYRLEVSLFPKPGNTARADLDRAHHALMSVHGSLLTPYVELAFARVIDLDSRDLDRKIGFSGRVMRFAPTPVITYRHAALLALKGEHAQAAQQLDLAVTAYPGRLKEFAEEIAGIAGRDGEALAVLSERIQRHRASQRNSRPVK
jgi:O-antigen ligase